MAHESGRLRRPQRVTRLAIACALAAGCADRPIPLPELTADLAGPTNDLGVRDAAVSDLAAADLAVPWLRQIAPLSTSTVTARRPTVSWEGGSQAAQAELCRDRACTQRIGGATTDAKGNRARPDSPLPPGVVFWRVRDGASVTSTWELFVGARDAAVDSSYGTTLDVNGDGLGDVAVAGPLYGFNGLTPGYVYLGAAAGMSSAPAATLTDPAAPGPVWLGMWRLSSAGDLDGDGYGDLVYSSIQNDTPNPTLGGLVHVIYGGAGGLGSARSTLLGAPAGTAQFGHAVAALGDFDGDGYGDLLVTTVNDTPPAFIYYGGAAGLDSGRFARIDNASFSEGFTAVAGDFNGDGLGDFVLSADQDQLGGVQPRGRAFVFYGTAGPPLAPSEIDAPANVLRFSSFLAALDLNGDGYCDLLSAGDPNSDGNVYVYRGGAGGLSAQPAQTLARPSGLPGFASAGDLDGDGRDDLLFGAGSQVGRASVLLSGSAGPLSLSGPGNFGVSLSGANDVDGDGHEDIIVGAPGLPLGRAFIYYGRAGGLAVPDGGRSPLEIDSPPFDGGSGAFGGWVAGKL